MQRDFMPTGQTPAVVRLVEDTLKVAPTEATALILGESGTGKERLARTIHAHSARAEGPFVVCDCSALPPSLIESELFGHTRGAFTGAERDRPGLFREAAGGSIFLDEIGELDIPLQAKLLGVIQNRKLRPVGSDDMVDIDVRVIAATHQDLRRGIEDGAFRRDLYYRLAVYPLRVPPLRERLDDLGEIAAEVLAHAASWLEGVPEIEPEALQQLRNHSWPGNIRELENVLVRATIRTGGAALTVQSLGTLERGESSVRDERVRVGEVSLAEMVADATGRVEREAIAAALDQSAGSITQAAKLLRVSRGTLYAKMQRYDLAYGFGRRA